MTGEGTRPAGADAPAGGPGLWPDLRWIGLLVAGVAVLVAAAVTADFGRAPVGTVVALVGLGVVGELADGRGAVSGPWRLGVVFAGAAGLLVGVRAGPWAALLVGLSGLLGNRQLRDVVADTTLLMVAVGVVGAVGDVAGELLPEGAVLAGSATVLGEPVPSVSLASVLLGGVAAAPLLQITRRLRARLDRRRSSVGLRARLRAAWPRDVATAATMALAAALWAVHPVLTLVLLLPSLVAMRTTAAVPTGAGGEVEPASGASLLRTAVLTELRRSAELDRPVAVLHLLLDAPSLDEATVAAVGEQLAVAARDYDVVGRVGPGALAVVLPEADRTTAVAAAERLLGAVRDVGLPGGGDGDDGPPPAVSVGVAVCPADTADREELLVEAEMAAQGARARGGERVVTAGELPADFRGDRDTTVAGRAGSRAGDPVDGDSLVQVARTSLGRGVHAPQQLLSGTVGAAVVVTVAAVLVTGPRLAWVRFDPADVLVFGGLALVAEGLASSVAGRAVVSWTALPLVGIGALAGVSPLSVVAVAVVAGAGGGWLRGVGPRQLAFNTGTFVLAAVAAFGAASMAGPVFGQAPAATIARGVVGGAGFLAVDVGLVVAVVSASFELPAGAVWRQDLRWLAAHQVGLSLLAGVLAHLHTDLGATAAVLLALPAAALQWSLARMSRRSSRTVARLRERDEELDAANDRLTVVNQRLSGVVTGLSRGYLDTLTTLAVVVDHKDGYDGSHVDRVVAYGRRLLDVADPTLAADEALLWGFRLHDVGKIGLPDGLLGQPEPLSDEQWELMRTHPRRGAELVAGLGFLAPAREVILHHHERWDGTGYPFGLAGEAIPLGARVFAIVDAFDAMTSQRPYRNALDLEGAFHELVRGRGTQFDPELVERFLELPREQLDAIRQRPEHPEADLRPLDVTVSARRWPARD